MSTDVTRQAICTNKARYPSRDAARAQVRRLRRTGVLAQCQYHCPHCGTWHVGPFAGAVPAIPDLPALNIKKAGPKAPRIRHSSDYTAVSFGVLRWKFPRRKARIIRVVMEAGETEHPEVDGVYLRERTGMRTEIRQLFDGDPAWRTLLVPLHPVRPGFYRRASLPELQFLLKMHLANAAQRTKSKIT